MGVAKYMIKKLLKDALKETDYKVKGKTRIVGFLKLDDNKDYLVTVRFYNQYAILINELEITLENSDEGLDESVNLLSYVNLLNKALHKEK